MVLSDSKENTIYNEDIKLAGAAPMMICSRCGAQYTSSGKKDSGLCPACFKKLVFGFFIGGPLDGQKTDS